MDVKFGDVVYVDFGESGNGSVQKGKRPAVIVQNDVGNRFSPTSIVTPLTSEIKKLNMPCHELLRATKWNGLREDSMILGEQVQVIDKSNILSKIGSLNQKECILVLKAYFANVPKEITARA